MALIPLSLNTLREERDLLYFLQRLNQRCSDLQQQLAAKQADDKPLDLNALTQRVRQELGVRGGYPLDVTGLHGKLAETQPSQLLILSADPTVAANNIDANLYEVGELATFSGGFYYVKAGNPHTWQTLSLSLPSNGMTTNTDQNPITGKKTFTVDQTFAKILTTDVLSQYNSIATVGNGIASIYAVGSTGPTGANASGTLYSIPGSPAASRYLVLINLFTTTAGTAGSTVNANVSWTDSGSTARGILGGCIAGSVGYGCDLTSATGTAAGAFAVLDAKPSTNITFTTTGTYNGGAQYKMFYVVAAL